MVHRAAKKHLAPSALSTLKTKENDKTNFGEDLAVLMLNETEKQQDVGAEYFVQEHLDNR